MVKLPATHGPSDKISNVHGHLVDLGGVVLLDVPQDADVVVLHKVDGDAFPAVPARAADSVDVELSVVGQVIVNDQRHLRHIQASSPNVCGNKNSACTRSELFHDGLSLLLGHVPMHG